MKKTILVATLALLGVGAATANDDFKLFADKKTKSTIKTVAPKDGYSVQQTTSETKFVQYKDGKAVEVAPLAVKSSPDIAKEVYLQKMMSSKSNLLPVAAESVVEDKVGSENEVWAKQYKNTYPSGLDMFKDNGSADYYAKKKIHYYADNTVKTSDSDDHLFFDIISEIEKIQAGKKNNTERSQLKLKGLDFKIHELAQKGNMNSIDYLCINPKQSPYIQVDVMKHYCDIASANNHVEFLGYRAWVDDPSHVKVGNARTNRKQHDHLLLRSLNDNASWALMIEAQRAPNEAIRQKVIEELTTKESPHWLHGGAIKLLKSTPHELPHKH